MMLHDLIVSKWKDVLDSADRGVDRVDSLEDSVEYRGISAESYAISSLANG